jgi:hypothetical protein
MTTIHLRKIDPTGLFVEDALWDDGAYPAQSGLPKMTEGQPSVPPVLDADGTEIVPELPEVLPAQELDADGNPVWITPPVEAFDGNPIPPDMVAEPVPGGFFWPRWDGKAWVEGGEAPKPPPVSVVGMDQARKVLVLNGVDLDSIPQIFNALEEPARSFAKIDWEFKAKVHIDNPLVLVIAEQKKWSQARLQDMFNLAATLS